MNSLKKSIPVLIFTLTLISFSINIANAESVPEWVKKTALWYGEGTVSETEFINMIKFLIVNDIISVDSSIVPSKDLNAEIIIPNGNSGVSSSSFYLPWNLETTVGTTVTWINEDSVQHTIQSQDGTGKIVAFFNSAILNTGDKFEFTFEDAGVYHYFCSIHPWRVGVVTVK